MGGRDGRKREKGGEGGRAGGKGEEEEREEREGRKERLVFVGFQIFRNVLTVMSHSVRENVACWEVW